MMQRVKRILIVFKRMIAIYTLFSSTFMQVKKVQTYKTDIIVNSSVNIV